MRLIDINIIRCAKQRGHRREDPARIFSLIFRQIYLKAIFHEKRTESFRPEVLKRSAKITIVHTQTDRLYQWPCLVTDDPRQRSARLNCLFECNAHVAYSSYSTKLSQSL